MRTTKVTALACAAFAIAPAVYAACGGSSGASGLADDGGADATLTRDGAPSSSGDGGVVAPEAKTPIKHVVFLVKENRTFDNYFGQFPGANGATNGKISDGGTVQLAPLLDKSSPDIRASSHSSRRTGGSTRSRIAIATRLT